jgi:hypothetical protein
MNGTVRYHVASGSSTNEKQAQIGAQNRAHANVS